VWTGLVATLLICTAVAFAFYYEGAARRWRRHATDVGAHVTGLESDFYRLCQEALPRLVTRVHEGASTETVLAEVAPTANVPFHHLLGTVAHEIGMADRRAADAVRACTALEKEIVRLGDETVPALVKRVHEGASAETVLAEVAPAAAGPFQRLLVTVAEEIGAADRRGAAAMAACASAAARVQAQTTRVLAELRELEHKYSEDEIFAALLELDHRVSQMGRLADSIAVLSGGRSGRRWTKPIGMESILRGAMGRVEAYRRVRLHTTSAVALAGYAAEGTMHALAELIDNAVTFSNKGTPVDVYVEEEDAGVVIRIEDGGLGMRRRERLRAESLVSEPSGLTTLSGTRLGLAVVGRLAEKYGFKVNFRPSSRGGTGVVVMIPRHLIVQPRSDLTPALAAPAEEPERAQALPARRERAEATGENALTTPTDEDGGLPRRRRGATLAAATPASAPVERPTAERQDAGKRFAAFRQAVGGGRDQDASGAGRPDPSGSPHGDMSSVTETDSP
jgi:signal transduction histidine kinase